MGADRRGGTRCAPGSVASKRLKELEKENLKLKRLMAELLLEKQVLKDVAEGNF